MLTHQTNEYIKFVILMINACISFNDIFGAMNPINITMKK